jgi:C1A family cysteine protease
MIETNISSKTGRHYFSKIDKEDTTKLNYLSISKKESLPSSVDLRNKFKEITDQGQLGACTAFALSGIIGYTCQNITPSELFIYYNERSIRNTVNTDSGAYLSDGIKSLINHGVCQENLWPYNINKFKVKPTVNCYQQAANNKALSVKNIRNTLDEMKNCLASGLPFVVAIPVFTSFESQSVARTGIVPMPSSKEKLLGYHAISCVGYDDTKKWWIMRNSWGKWGDKGYFYLPYEYLTKDYVSDNISGSDLWVIIKMNNNNNNNKMIIQINKIKVMNKIREINQINKIKETNKINLINQINKIREMNKTNLET